MLGQFLKEVLNLQESISSSKQKSKTKNSGTAQRGSIAKTFNTIAASLINNDNSSGSKSDNLMMAFMQAQEKQHQQFMMMFMAAFSNGNNNLADNMFGNGMQNVGLKRKFGNVNQDQTEG